MKRYLHLLGFALLPAVICPAVSPPGGTSTEGPTKGDVTVAATNDATADDVAVVDEEDREMSVWMEKKLQHSQAILRALAMGDFDAVKDNSGRLKVLNRVEGFVRRRNPEYRSHLHTFSRVVSEIERQAERENIEGATLAFNQLTVSCVQCHTSLRNEAAVAADADGPVDVGEGAGESGK